MVKRIAKQLIDCFERGNKCFVIGNGGSAVQASHLVGELLGHFEKDRKPLPAISLFDLSTITAIANDDGYEHIFERQIEALGKNGDVLIILSTSGKSWNCVFARNEALKKNMEIISFPTGLTAKTQEKHLKIIHGVCRLIDKHYETYRN